MFLCNSCCKAKKKKNDKPQTPIYLTQGPRLHMIDGIGIYEVNKTSIRNPDKEQGVFAIYNQKNASDAKARMEKFNISKYYIKSEDKVEKPVTTPNKNELWAKSGKLKDEYFNIDKNKPHLTAAFTVHGDKEFRKFCKAEDPGTATGLIDDFFNLFHPGDIESKKSFYFKSAACFGAYHDGTKTIFDKIQDILKKCSGEPPKCFVKIGKKDFQLCIGECTTDGKEIDKKVILPNEEWPKEATKGEYSVRYKRAQAMHYDCCTNPSEKDKYFDYYYVTKDAIYKVPHALVHNRVKLIDEGEFDNAFKYLCPKNVDINKDIDDKDYREKSREKFKYLRLKNVDMNKDPDDDKYNKKNSKMSGLARKCSDKEDFAEWWKYMEFIKKCEKRECEQRKKSNLITIPKSWHKYY